MIWPIIIGICITILGLLFIRMTKNTDNTTKALYLVAVLSFIIIFLFEVLSRTGEDLFFRVGDLLVFIG